MRESFENLNQKNNKELWIETGKSIIEILLILFFFGIGFIILTLLAKWL